MKIRGEETIAACSGCATGTLMTSMRNSAEFGSWSGASFDPVRQLLVVPVQNLAHVVTLEEVGEHPAGSIVLLDVDDDAVAEDRKSVV